jgi:hypothetical protein
MCSLGWRGSANNNNNPDSAEIATERVLRMYFYGLDPPVKRIGAMRVLIPFSLPPET